MLLLSVVVRCGITRVFICGVVVGVGRGLFDRMIGEGFGFSSSVSLSDSESDSSDSLVSLSLDFSGVCLGNVGLGSSFRFVAGVPVVIVLGGCEGVFGGFSEDSSSDSVASACVLIVVSSSSSSSFELVATGVDAFGVGVSGGPEQFSYDDKILIHHSLTFWLMLFIRYIG